MSEYGEFIQEDMGVSIVGGLGEPRVSVIGCGGAGNNVVESLYWNHPGLDTIAVSDNEERLSSVGCSSAIFVKPEDIQEIEEQYYDCIRAKLSDSDIAFVVVGLGGVFGSVVAPLVARVAHDVGMTVISIGIHPFDSEQRTGMDETVQLLRTLSDATIVIDNNRLFEIADDISVDEGFGIINSSVSKIITTVTTRISEQIVSMMRGDIAEEIRFDIMSLSDTVHQPSAPADNFMEPSSGLAQAAMFSVEGPAFNFM